MVYTDDYMYVVVGIVVILIIMDMVYTLVLPRARGGKL